jgi:hypothetical protein
MKSPLKIIVGMAVAGIVSASVVVVVHQSRPAHRKITAPINVPGNELPAALSNYSHTFKLNTNPPVWPTTANGRSTTN